MPVHRRFSLSRAVSALTVTALLCGPVAALPAYAEDSFPVPEVVPGAATTAAPAGQQADRMIVKFKDNVRGNAAERGKAYGQAAKASGISVQESHTTASGATVVQATKDLTGAEAAAAAAALDAQPDVEYAEVDAFLRPTGDSRVGPPDDPGIPLQWSLDEEAAGMRVPGAWPRSTGAGTVVAVIDTGITPHSDLDANLIPGYDFISSSLIAGDGNGRDPDNRDAGDSCDGAPSSWHGTHVAGTIGAIAYNGKGVAGVAFDAKIQPIRALGKCGGYLSDIADALTWAVGGSISGVAANPTPADVVNMSLGGATQCTTTFQRALDYAESRNAIVIAAAGNENSPVAGFTPANCEKIIAVAATGREGNRAGYSNYGPGVDVSASGGDFSTGVESGIVSTYNDGWTTPGGESYAYMQGTSMAAPQVAAVAALMRSTARSGGITLTPAQIEDKLKETARPLPGTCDTGGCGTGLVDATAAARSANPAPLPFRAIPISSLEGTAVVGNQLSVSTTASSFLPAAEALTYQWMRDTTPIPDATAATYRITDADAGARLSIRMTATKFDYQTTTTDAGPTEPVAERPVTPAPVISGTPQVGKPLTVTPGTWTPGPVTFKYQWIRGSQPIEGATGETYTPVAADAGKNLKVRATGSGPKLDETSVDSEPSAAVLQGVLTSPVPEISGTPRIGERLQAVAGMWTEGAALTYQWLRDGADIPSATGAAYDPVAGDLGKAVSVRVTGTKDGYAGASQESAQTPAVEAGTLSAPSPQITGTPAVGLDLTAGAGDWSEGTSLSYQWFRDGAEIPDATVSTYSLTADDLGKTLTVRVTGTLAGYNTESTESDATAVVQPGTLIAPEPAVTGTAKVGESLTAVPGSWAPNSTLSYQWYRSEVAVLGATGPTYLLGSADYGKALKVRVTGAKAGYTTAAAESAPTAAVADGTLASSAPAITGTARVGYPLVATPFIWTAGTSHTYQWYRSGIAITGATAATYTLTAADLGKAMKVRVTGTKAGYTTAARESVQTAAVAAGTLSAPTPGINGTKKVGYTLTAAPGTWSAGTALRYQWYRSGTAITGATGSRYTLGAADLGKGMKVLVTGSKAGYASASRFSGQTSAVVAGTLSGPNPRITGTLRPGYVLTANAGTWTPGTTLRYQWYRSGVAIKGATGRQYRLVAADRYDTMRVRVIGSKPGYTSLARYSGITSRVR